MKQTELSTSLYTRLQVLQSSLIYEAVINAQVGERSCRDGELMRAMLSHSTPNSK